MRVVRWRRAWAFGSAALLALISCVPGELFLTPRDDGGVDSKVATEASGGGGTAGTGGASGSGGMAGNGGTTGRGGSNGTGPSDGAGGDDGPGDSSTGVLCSGVDAAEPQLDLTPACESCIGAMCCSKLQACIASPGCEAIVHCTGKCLEHGGSVTSCADGCLTKSEAGSGEGFAESLYLCASSNCSGCYSD
jgi:hypothetical protein